MQWIIGLVVNGLAVWLTAMFLPGVTVDGFGTAILVAIVLAVVNILVKPVLILFSLPVTILSLGLFIFVIDAVVILIVSNIVAGFHVEGFWIALFFAVILGIIGSILDALMGIKK